MTATRSGIPTTYGGTRFRSRLEGRWAAFFDLVGWSWTYEPFDAESTARPRRVGERGRQGLWGECLTCQAVGIAHAQMSYHLRPCGHAQSGSFGRRVEGVWLTALWRRAGNDVQWIARRPTRVGEILRAVR